MKNEKVRKVEEVWNDITLQTLVHAFITGRVLEKHPRVETLCMNLKLQEESQLENQDLLLHKQNHREEGWLCVYEISFRFG